MARKFNTNGIADGTLPGTKIASGSLSAASVSSVRISSIIITDNSYVLLDDSAVILTGGYIKLFGIGFVNGCSVAIDTTIATSVSFVSSTELNVQVPAKAAGTYNLYLTTPTGAVAIRVNAITYSSTPTWSSTSPLPGGVNNTAISIQLGATSDSTVSYTVQAGSTLPTGLTLSSGGLLSGTVTGLVLETTYNFTVVATDVELQDSPKAFSITIVVSDPYFKNTVLLLQGDLTPFTADASTNKFELSAVGTPSANTNNPLQPGYYSNYFVNGYPYLRATANSAFNFGTGDFTVEFWYYSVSIVADSRFISNASYAASGIDISYESTSSRISWYIGSTSYNTATLPAANKWHHIAYSRTSTTLYVYVDGVLVNTYASFTANITSASNLTIGGNVTGVETLDGGYISNLRLVKGVSIYSTGANFTPSTTPLTAISGTSLLTCQSNRFIDNSVNNFTFTVNGSVTVNSFQPFTLPSPYTGYGSGLFNGTGDYLQSPSNAALTLGTSDFTIEAWVYLTVAGSASVIGPVWDGRPSVNGAYPYLLVQGNTTNYNVAWYVNATNQVTAPTLALNTWHHIAYSRSYATAGRLFVNGALIQSWVDNVNYLGSQGRIGSNYDASGLLGGYISNLRITKGTAVYTGAFTPPTLAPLTNAGATSAAAYPSTTNVDITFASSATSLLTLQNNQAQNNNQFRDSSTNNFAITRTGTPTQGTFTPFSQTGWSGYLASQQYIYTPANTTFDITAVDFTVEFWVYFTAYNTMGYSGMTVIGNFQSSNGWLCGLNGIGGLTGLSFNTYSAGALVSNLNATGITSTNLPLNSWHHIAFVRSGSNFYFFLDGVSYNATSAPTAVGAGGQLAIGVYQQNMTYSGNPSWYLSNMRIVKGVAVYTGNFTPPTAPLTATQSGSGNIAAITGTATSLLTFNSNRFIDNIATPNIFAVSGTPSIQSFSPFAPSAAYSAATVGGGIYFNGGTDRLTTPSDSSFAFGTGDFTVEFWIYALGWNASDYNALCTFSTGSIGMYSYSGGYLNYNNGAGYQISSGIRPVLNQWNHIALCRGSGSSKLYLNGVQVGSTYADTTNFAAGATNVNNATYPTQAYYANFRVVKGTAVYTGAFTPPTAPLTAIAGTSVLLNATNTGIFDATGKNDLITVGDARVSTSVTKYGTGAMYFDGTGDWLSINAPTNLLNFGTADFTIECWIYLLTVPSTSGPPIITNENGFYINFRGSGTFALTDISTVYATSPSALTAGSWFHVAIVRSAGSSRIYVNGTGGTAVACSVNWTATTIAYIGGSPGYSPVNCYIDDFRVTKYARYTTTFTPPSQAMLGM